MLLSLNPLVPIFALITNKRRAYLAGALSMVPPFVFFALFSHAYGGIYFYGYFYGKISSVSPILVLTITPLVLALVIGHLQLKAYRNT